MSAIDEREYSWVDEDTGDYYYLNRFMGFRFAAGTEVPEDYRDKPDATDAAKKLLKGLLEETAKFDTEQVEALTLKQITERTEKTKTGMRLVRLGRSAYSPNYVKTIRRTFKDAAWYTRPDKGELSTLYVVDPYSMQTVGILMPMRIAT